MQVVEMTGNCEDRNRIQKGRRWVSAGLRVLGAAILTCGIVVSVDGKVPAPSVDAAVVHRAHASPVAALHTPFYLEKNVGQAPRGIQFLAHAGSETLAITNRGAVIATSGHSLLHITPLGGASHLHFQAAQKRPGIINYFLGKDPRNWHTNVPTYGQVTYRNVYRHVDLTFHGQGQRLEYDWIVRPGGDANRIRLKVSGGSASAVDAHGILHFGNLPLLETRPTIYQQFGGKRRLIQGGYVLASAHTVRFRVGHHDRTRPLVIDPVLISSQRIGGSGNDVAGGIKVDTKGNIYLAGSSDSADFGMIKNAYQKSRGGGRDIYVVKLRSNGSLLYGTYVGGTDEESAQDLAIDGAGRAYVAGDTISTDFPKSGFGGPGAVALCLNPRGNSLRYSVVTNADSANAVAVDGHANAYFAVDTDIDGLVMKVTHGGHTSLSTVIPTLDAGGVAVTKTGTVVLAGTIGDVQLQTVHAVQPTYAGGVDGFVVGFNSHLNQILFSTYLGGTEHDEANAVTVGGSNNIFVTGSTESTDFPATVNVDVTQSHSPFVAKFSSDGRKLLYSTVIGSIPETYAREIAVNKRGTVVIGGLIRGSGLYPANPLPGGMVFGGGNQDGFLSALDVSGSDYTFNTYLGGSGTDDIRGLAFGGSGNLFVVGNTNSPNFPRTSGPQFNAAGKYDGFLIKVGKLK